MWTARYNRTAAAVIGRRAHTLAGRSRLQVVAQDAVEELDAQGAGDGEHRAIGELRERRRFAGGGMHDSR